MAHCNHVWQGCACVKCGAVRDAGHAFESRTSDKPSCSGCPYKVTGVDNQSFGCYGEEEGDFCRRVTTTQVCTICGKEK